jgi:integrase
LTANFTIGTKSGHQQAVDDGCCQKCRANDAYPWAPIPKGTWLKGATVNRELECLKCVFDLAVKRKYIPENPAAAVKHFNELRERPIRRMLTVEEELRILEAAPPHLRVAIILLSRTGGRTYSEGFSLRWDQMNFEDKLIRLDNNVKTPGSAEPIPLSEYACEVLQAWNKAQAPKSPFVFPGPHLPDQPISTVKTAWKATLRRAGVPTRYDGPSAASR